MSTTMTPLPIKEATPSSTAYSGYITQITLPSTNKYEIVDEGARQTITTIETNINSVSSTVNTIETNINSVSATVNNLSTTVTGLQNNINSLSTTVSSLANLSGYSQFLGVLNPAVTVLSDGSTQEMIAIGNSPTAATTAVIGAIVIQPQTNGRPAQEFIYDSEGTWQLFGDIDADNLGELATADAVSTTYTPAGSIISNNSTFTTTGSLTVTSNITVPINITAAYTPQGSVASSLTAINYIGKPTIIAPSGSDTNNYIQCISTGDVNTTITTSTATVIGSVELNVQSNEGNSNGAIAYVNEHSLYLASITLTSTTVDMIASVTGTSSFTSTPIYLEKQSTTIVTEVGDFTGTAANISITSSAAATVNISTTITTIGNVSDMDLHFSGTAATITAGPATNS